MDELVKAAAELKARITAAEAAEAAAELEELERQEAEAREAERARASRAQMDALSNGLEANGHGDPWAGFDAQPPDPAVPASPPVQGGSPWQSQDDSDLPGVLVLWRRKSMVILLTILLGCAFGAVYFLLPERYESTVRLEARSSGKQSSFEFLQASQILGRTYSEIARSRVIADLVARRLPFTRTKSSVLDDVSVVTVSDTPLIKITATQEKRSEARQLANVYASTLLRYVDKQSRAEQGSLSLVHPAESATRAGPGLPLMAGLGCLIGLLLGIAIAFFEERLDVAEKRRTGEFPR